MRHRLAAVIVVGLTLAGSPAPASGTPTSGPSPARRGTAPNSARLRVDQVGYARREAKLAILMTSRPAAGVPFRIERGTRVVFTGRVGTTDRGRWNATYRHTYAVRFTGLRATGRFRVVVASDPPASATIRIVRRSDMYRHVLLAGLQFDRTQRDGNAVPPGPLQRKPSHRNDAHAAVYVTPHFDPDTDEITDPTLTPTGAHADLAGGWFDAGDYLKFTHTTAFADVVLQVARRDLGRAAPGALIREARHGLSWLRKAWRPRSKTLYLQVGIGNGTANGRYLGDHDLWRLPEQDDRNRDPAAVFAARHRPAFLAAAPGQPISPNLAGRVAAAFALAAQVDPPGRAVTEYRQAVAILHLADTTSPPRPLTTALPNDFYPEDTWRDDMELGTAEVARAAERLHRPAATWLRQSTHWAREYVRHEAGGDTFNLYDVSALAHTDLVRALAHRSTRGLAIGRAGLLSDLARQLRGAAQHSAADPFAAAGDVTEFDVDAHTFGVIAMAGWYHAVTGSSRFDRLATQQRDWLFGRNAWGVSFMVGLGQRYPQCMQHQIANLRGSTDGTPPIDVGAVVNGPNSADLFSDGLDGFQDGMRHCTSSGLQQFDGRGSRYLDDVRSWQTDEPALDMTGAAIAAASAQLTRDR